MHFRLDHDDDDPVINLTRGQSSEAAAGEDEGQAEQPAPHVKRLDFSFFAHSYATNIYNSNASYHTVRGEKRRGLLVDPGAASGLIGSETLRDLLEHCVPESKVQDIHWRYDRTSNVSGISGNPESTLGEVSIPLTLSGAVVPTKQMSLVAKVLCARHFCHIQP